MQSKNVVMLDVVYTADKQNNNNNEYIPSCYRPGGGGVGDRTHRLCSSWREKAEL